MILIAERRDFVIPVDGNTGGKRKHYRRAIDVIAGTADSIGGCHDIIMRHVALDPEWTTNRTYTFIDYATLLVQARGRYHGGRGELRVHEYQWWASYTGAPRRTLYCSSIVRELLDIGFVKTPNQHPKERSFEKPVFLHEKWLQAVALIGMDFESVMDWRMHLVDGLTELSDPFQLELNLVYLERFGVFKLYDAVNGTKFEIEISPYWMGDGYSDFLQWVGVTPETCSALLAKLDGQASPADR